MAQKDTTMNSTASGARTDSPGWREIQEQAAWDDYIAWCRAQENSAHE